MPYLTVLADWVQQSMHLIQARPTTTRITSKYSLTQPTSATIKKRKRDTEKQAEAKELQEPAGPRAELKVKTYDPESGACLMYKTDQAAEVKQLLRSLGKLGRDMAGLPEILEDPTAALDVPEQENTTRSQTPLGDAAAKAKDGKPQAADGGGKKKKKKGKK